MSTEKAEPTNRRQVGRETIVQREGLEVLRLDVPTGGAVPEHHATVDVVVVVVSGSGVFTVAGEPRRIRRGDVIDMAPAVRHSIAAEEDLTLVVVKARLAS
jgi:quercetin dioxygenase-like cupin family protein